MARNKRSHDRHAARRAWERYGLEISPRNLQQVVADIQNGRAQFVEGDSNTRTKWLVELAGRNCYVVYSKVKKTIVTVLPAEALFDRVGRKAMLG